MGIAGTRWYGVYTTPSKPIPARSLAVSTSARYEALVYLSNFLLNEPVWRMSGYDWVLVISPEPAISHMTINSTVDSELHTLLTSPLLVVNLAMSIKPRKNPLSLQYLKHWLWGTQMSLLCVVTECSRLIICNNFQRPPSCKCYVLHLSLFNKIHNWQHNLVLKSHKCVPPDYCITLSNYRTWNSKATVLARRKLILKFVLINSQSLPALLPFYIDDGLLKQPQARPTTTQASSHSTSDRITLQHMLFEANVDVISATPFWSFRTCSLKRPDPLLRRFPACQTRYNSN